MSVTNYNRQSEKWPKQNVKYKTSILSDFFISRTFGTCFILAKALAMASLVSSSDSSSLSLKYMVKIYISGKKS